MTRSRKLAYKFLTAAYKRQNGRRITNGIARWVHRRTVSVTVNGTELRFLAGLGASEWRSTTMHRKEPETLEWIDGFPVGSCFWDVGASTGIFSVYAALRRQCRVISVDLLPNNYEIIVKNASLNDVADSVLVLPIPLSDRSGPVLADLVSDEIGTSQHQLVSSSAIVPPRGSHLQTIAITIDDCIRYLQLPRPDFIKVDVDGLEHLVLRGGGEVLKSVVKSVLVEKQKHLGDRATTVALLEDLGFRLVTETHGNFIWAKR